VTRSIYLVGFMGAGKTMVGARLARVLQWPFVDLDRLVGDTAGRTIAAIFEQEGEAAFREMEEAALATVSSPAVVALGGGAFITPGVRSRVARTGLSVFLDWPIEILCDRVAGDPRRPLAGELPALKALFERRFPIYRRADIHWRSQPPHRESADQVAADILRLLPPGTR